ncbi:MAG: isoamylase early set domain-containing protein [bacterium]
MRRNEIREMVDGLKSAPMITVPDDFTYLVVDRVNRHKRGGIAKRGLRNVAAGLFLIILIGIGVFLFPKNRLNSADIINVKFQLEMPVRNNIQTISLAGDFNGWDTKVMMLNLTDNNKWTINVPLKKGRYQYMFVIDGGKWMPDPAAKRLIADGFGGENSLLEL